MSKIGVSGKPISSQGREIIHNVIGFMQQKAETGVKIPITQYSLLSSEVHRKSKKKRKKIDVNDDSHEDDESSVIQSAKTNNCKNVRYVARCSGRLGSNNSVIHKLKQNSVLRIKNSLNDANNNKTLKVPSRKPHLTTIPTPIVPIPCPDPVKLSSTKLPSPCRTCGRPDLPERFHSHPATPLKPSPRNIIGIVSPVAVDKTQKLPVKSTVQKPIAIKYKSKNGSAEKARKVSPLKKSSNQTSSLPVPTVKKSPALSTNKVKDSLSANNSEAAIRSSSAVSEKETTMNGGSVTPLRGGSGKRTLTCFICGREFGTASLKLHEPKCMEKWGRENANLPPNMRRKPPVKPEGTFSQKELDQLAWESSQAALVPCNNCGRTFYPDRLVVHQKSCKAQNNNTKRASSNEAVHSTSSSPMSQKSDPPSSSASSKPHQPPSVECYICGRMFGTHSIEIHEKKCLKKWHAENESLPFDMRSPTPTKSAATHSQPPISPHSSSATPSPKSSKEERPISGTRSPLFPCYLCGKLFTVNSIYIHEPQCLKMWKIENDKLPPNKRRSVPLKPDIKFTRSGKINFEDTSEAYWQSHINQLIPCKLCSRTFNPDRIHVHERSCKGN